MTAAPFVAEHGDRASRDATDAYQDMKAHHANEDRVNRGHRDTEHDSRVIRHRDALPVFESAFGTSPPLLGSGIGAERALADPPDEGIAERDQKAKDKPWLVAEREHARDVAQYCRCHPN